MKNQLLCASLLVTSAAIFSIPSEVHSQPAALPRAAEIDTGGFILYQNGNSLDSTGGEVSGDDWYLCGFLLVEQTAGQLHELWVLADKVDPTGDKRWVPYVWPGAGSTYSKDVATRFQRVTDLKDKDEAWLQMLAGVGMEEEEVNEDFFQALASDPTVGTLP